MFKLALSGVLALAFALGLAACDPQQSHDAVAAICTSANIVLPVAQPFASGKWAAKIAAAEAKVSLYCNSDSAMNLPNAAAALTAALNGIAPLIHQTPVALTALKTTPVWGNPAFQRGWARLGQ